MMRDITIRFHIQRALRQSEEQYRTLVEAMNDGLVLTDQNGTIVFTNKRFCDMIGYSRNEVIGARLIDFIDGDGRSVFAEESRAEKTADFETVLRSKTGERIYAICAPRRMRDEKGETEGTVAVFTDITERKRLEREILEIGIREQRRIGRDLHDDIGQILTGTGFLCENLARALTKRGMPEAEEARTICSLINQAKERTRTLSRGLSPVEIDSGGLVEALERFVGNIRSVYSIDCVLRVEGSVDIRDSVVETQFHYIVQEAVTNAIRHGRARRIEICLSTRPGLFRLSVEDDGVGLPHNYSAISGMGIHIMRYRASAVGALLTIRNKTRGRGVAVICDWRYGRDGGKSR